MPKFTASLSPAPSPRKPYSKAESLQTTPRDSEETELNTANEDGPQFEPVILDDGTIVQPTLVLDTFFYWAHERYSMLEKRLKGVDDPLQLTDDPILHESRFTNTSRVHDRATQFLIKRVINVGPQSHVECCFRVLLFRFFNRPETWELLEEKLGVPLTWEKYDVDAYKAALDTLNGGTVYTAAYQVQAPKLGGKNMYHNHLLYVVELMTTRGLPEAMLAAQSMEEAYTILRGHPQMGVFNGFQMAMDMSYTPHVNWSEHVFAAAGPGSQRGLEKMFGPNVIGHELSAMRYLYRTQFNHFHRLGLTNIPRVSLKHGTGLTMSDIEHIACETDKYCRKKYPDIRTGADKRKVEKAKLNGKGKSANPRIKAKFAPKRPLEPLEFPAKWNLAV